MDHILQKAGEDVLPGVRVSITNFCWTEINEFPPCHKCFIRICQINFLAPFIWFLHFKIDIFHAVMVNHPLLIQYKYIPCSLKQNGL